MTTEELCSKIYQIETATPKYQHCMFRYWSQDGDLVIGKLYNAPDSKTYSFSASKWLISNPLEGTEKQVEWASSVRYQVNMSLVEIIEQATDKKSEQALNLAFKAISVLQNKTDAHYWIDFQKNIGTNMMPILKHAAKSTLPEGSQAIELVSLLNGIEPKTVAEPDLEDALNTIEALPFKGSEKQVKWAKDIALKNIQDVAIALKNNKTIPDVAKWWIDNRSNLVFS